MPPSLDRDIWDSTHNRAIDASIPTGFQHNHMASHVLLAACSQDQYAHEAMTSDRQPCGFFADNLIKQLCLVESNRTTYTELLSLLPELPFQTPQCEGENKKGFLFNGRAVVADPKVFKLFKTKEGIIKVLAGSIHGVITGTVFTAQDSNATPFSRRDLGVLVALEVNIDSSILGYPSEANKFDIPQGAKAVVSDWRNDASTLKVAIELGPDDPVVRAFFPERGLTQPEQVEQIIHSRFIKVPERANADIVIRRGPSDDDELLIERLDALIPKYAEVTTKFKFGVGMLDRFPYILDAIAQFNYHLARHNSADPFKQAISVELHKLKKLLDGRLRVPDESAGNLFIDNDARLLVDKEARYGLTIVNRSKFNLFPYLFYFDPSDYSISVCAFSGHLTYKTDV